MGEARRSTRLKIPFTKWTHTVMIPCVEAIAGGEGYEAHLALAKGGDSRAWTLLQASSEALLVESSAADSSVVFATDDRYGVG